MIKICDSIMGSGKTTAAINFMNEASSDARFLYITPFVAETIRIRDACPALNFGIPSEKIPVHGFSKGNHLRALLEEKRNVSITHSLFSKSDVETTRFLADNNYTVIIDEAMDILQEFTETEDDTQTMIKAGHLKLDESSDNPYYDIYVVSESSDYKSGRMSEFMVNIRNRKLFCEKGKLRGKRRNFWYWSMYEEMFAGLKELYILTYLFEYTSMRCYFDVNNISYQNIYVKQTEDNCYEFVDTPFLGDYVREVPNKIHILDKPKLNSIGDNKNALSFSWFKRESQKTNNLLSSALKNNIFNFFTNYHPDVPTKEKLWSTYDYGRKKIRGLGLTNSFLSFNSRACNDYGDCTVLAYCVNIFCNPNIVNYYAANGVDFNSDGYALSIMIQWIWRSAIRNGQDIYLYLPSKRMRDILNGWLDSLRAGIT